MGAGGGLRVRERGLWDLEGILSGRDSIEILE